MSNLSQTQAASAQAKPVAKPATKTRLADPHFWSKISTLALVAAVGVSLGWSALAEIEEVTRGEGKVIPASRIQVVQNLEGGIVRRIGTREGALVQEGDVILQIDATGFGSSLEERREKMFGLQAVVSRLSAHAEGKPFALPDEITQRRPDLAREQGQLFASRKRELEAAFAGLDLQAGQKRQEIEEVRAKVTNLQRALKLAMDEVALTVPLVQRGAAAKIELIRLESRQNELEGNLIGAELALPRLAQSLAEIEAKRREKEHNDRSETHAQLTEARVQLSSLEQGLKGDVDRVQRTEVRAPVTGLVKTLNITTVGQVVKPGLDIVEIVPINDTLLIEARVKPQDIAFLRPDLPAFVRISAYDYTLYGSLKARIEHIGADSVTTEKGETYYLVRARTEKANLEKDGRIFPIIPGMIANLDILTGKKTVLAYLVKPITKVQSQALRER
ncbi:MAG: HlyD family type I secretion periplasmic adaptor subunit [Bosea sp. (in: a-proteobacteria)]